MLLLYRMSRRATKRTFRANCEKIATLHLNLHNIISGKITQNYKKLSNYFELKS